MGEVTHVTYNIEHITKNHPDYYRGDFFIRAN